MKVYERVPVPGMHPEPKEELMVKAQVLLRDRPGSLAELSSLIAENGGNISIRQVAKSWSTTTGHTGATPGYSN
ncbi:MAG TPA: hypothetical protein EYP63_00215 [Desulfotomaculum sp.]|nr:hypothetical protein [Desulfotomaculum sp.]